MSIPVGGSATVEVVVDAIPVYTGLDGGIQGFAFNILYPNAGPGALSVTARATPLVAGDGKSLMTNYPTSTNISFSNSVPDTDGNFGVNEYDSDSSYESGEGRLYAITLTSVGAAGVAFLELGDTGAGDGDGIPDVYGSEPTAAENPVVGDAYIVVGGPCPPPTPSPTPGPPGVGGDVIIPVTGSDSSGGWMQLAAMASVLLSVLGAGTWAARRRFSR